MRFGLDARLILASGLRLRRKVNGLGLRLGLWRGLRPKVMVCALA